MTLIYLKTVLSLPGLPVVTHLAELEPVDSLWCRPLRMVELSPESAVTGAYRRTPQAIHNFSVPPQEAIAHPDHWGEMEDITATRILPSEFEALWLEAEQKFAGL